MATNHPQYLTEAQVSSMTGFALSSLRNNRWTRTGINYCKVGKRTVRYRLSDVIAFMESRIIEMEDSR
jgi:hypothetical protein